MRRGLTTFHSILCANEQSIRAQMLKSMIAAAIIWIRPWLTLGACVRVTVVVLCVCVSVCYQASCYIPCLQVQTAVLYHSLWRSKRMYYIVWILLKTLCSPVLAPFADGKLLDFSLSGTHCSIYTKGHVPVLYTVCSRVLVKVRPTEWSVYLELAVCKSLSGDKVCDGPLP